MNKSQLHNMLATRYALDEIFSEVRNYMATFKALKRGKLLPCDTLLDIYEYKEPEEVYALVNGLKESFINFAATFNAPINIDLKLFLRQRNTLNRVLMTKQLSKKEHEHLSGLQNLLDVL